MAVVTTCYWQVAQLAMKEVSYSETMILSIREDMAGRDKTEWQRHKTERDSQASAAGKN